LQPKIQVFNDSGLSARPELWLWVPCSVGKAKSPSLASTRMVDPSQARSTAWKAVSRVGSELGSVAWPAAGRTGRTRLSLRPSWSARGPLLGRYRPLARSRRPVVSRMWLGFEYSPAAVTRRVPDLQFQVTHVGHNLRTPLNTA